MAGFASRHVFPSATCIIHWEAVVAAGQTGSELVGLKIVCRQKNEAEALNDTHTLTWGLLQISIRGEEENGEKYKKRQIILSHRAYASLCRLFKSNLISLTLWLKYFLTNFRL